MRANRRKDTKPELALRRALHSQGYRYRKDYRLDLASGTRVRPDIAFTARKVAVFVDGCFWHGCPQHGSKPAVNVWYWEPKLRRNTERDRAADAALAAAGWAVVRVWEHESLEAAVTSVLAALTQASGRPLRRKKQRVDRQPGNRQPPDNESAVLQHAPVESAELRQPEERAAARGAEVSPAGVVGR
jgi:DNA mismatch endonuclease, patch repair protein